jgi:hypothetical protein
MCHLLVSYLFQNERMGAKSNVPRCRAELLGEAVERRCRRLDDSRRAAPNRSRPRRAAARSDRGHHRVGIGNRERSGMAVGVGVGVGAAHTRAVRLAATSTTPTIAAADHGHTIVAAVVARSLTNRRRVLWGCTHCQCLSTHHAGTGASVQRLRRAVVLVEAVATEATAIEVRHRARRVPHRRTVAVAGSGAGAGAGQRACCGSQRRDLRCACR